MRIGIVSDTHGHLEHTANAVRVLEEQCVELVLHCGDVGTADIVPLFAKWPTHFVFGNVDQDKTELRWAIDLAGQTCHGRFGSLHLQGRRVAFLHGDDTHALHQVVTGDGWDLICYGHTHVAEQHTTGCGTLVLNPGAVYRAHPHSLAVVDLSSLKASFVNL